jgi:Uma2 family endonuclease
LSEGTEAKDRGKKFEHYRSLETLKEYVLVAQDQAQVEVFRKNEAGLWVLHPFGYGDEVELVSLNIKVPIVSLYENVDLG